MAGTAAFNGDKIAAWSLKLPKGSLGLDTPLGIAIATVGVIAVGVDNTVGRGFNLYDVKMVSHRPFLLFHRSRI